MAWSDVAAKIKFWGVDDSPPLVNGISAAGYGGAFSPADKSTILSALQNLYDRSPTARALLDAGVATREIWLLNHAGQGSRAAINSGTATIDLDEARTLQWMGRDGRFQLENVGGSVIHELVHAIYGFYDLLDPVTGNPTFSRPGTNDFNNPNFDHIGRTQAVANQILQEAGNPFAYWQVGYDAIFNVSPSTFRTDISYTEGNTIDIAYFDQASNKTPDVLDLSLRTITPEISLLG
ncbi:hypothetical protein [uncultured Bradyrhizobium sp.]|uniref:hypothetical protein n=1 Tax=uncultured Bradyrhizobium sp. TaxID=199684 RepID=UPI0035C9774B